MSETVDSEWPVIDAISWFVQPIDFTAENVVQVLTDLPELFQDIQRAAQDRSLFLADLQEVAEGN